MYIAKTDFESVVRWYENTDYKAMLVFCSGFNPRDREITRQVAINKDYIDRATGEGICYLFFDALEDVSLESGNMYSILPVKDIPTVYTQSAHNANIRISEDVCNQFNILSSKLPALILVEGWDKAEAFSVDNYAHVETYVYASSLVSDCFFALDAVLKEKRRFDDSYYLKKSKVRRIQRSLDEVIQSIENNQSEMESRRKDLAEYQPIMEELQHDGYGALDEIVTKTHDAVVDLIEEMIKKTPKESMMSELYTSPDRCKDIIGYYGFSQDETILDVCKKIQEQLDKWGRYTGVRISKYMPHPSNKEYEKRLTDCLSLALTHVKYRIEGLVAGMDGNEKKLVELMKAKETLEETVRRETEVLQSSEAEYKEDLQKLSQKAGEIIDSYAEKTSKDLFLDMDKTKAVFEDYYQGLNFTEGLSKIFHAVEERHIPFNRKLQELRAKIEAHGFNVFISCKSEDYVKADGLYKFLAQKGLKPFLAEPNMRVFGFDVYDDTIRGVIDICDTMIVFTTNVAYLDTTYVHREWSMFSNDVLTGRKNGKLLTVVSPDIRPADLPIGLRDVECFSMDYDNNGLLSYVLNDQSEDSRY